MLRATASDGRFIIGIDADELDILLSGETLTLDLQAMGGTDIVLVMYGETMEAVTRKIEAEYGPIPEPFPWPEKPMN